MKALSKEHTNSSNTAKATTAEKARASLQVVTSKKRSNSSSNGVKTGHCGSNNRLSNFDFVGVAG